MGLINNETGGKKMRIASIVRYVFDLPVAVWMMVVCGLGRFYENRRLTPLPCRPGWIAGDDRDGPNEQAIISFGHQERV
jgi:hypothetical protein